jgi:hypothetical protein
LTLVPSPYTFLTALPALLGLAGFVLYQSIGANRYGREITQRIIDKLRRDSPAAGAVDERLQASQVERLLRGNQQLQRVVGQQDFQLLQQALQQQFVISLVVYVLAIAFCGYSVYLFAQQAAAKKELKLDHFSLSSTEPRSKGLPVDLDRLQLSWVAAGEPEDVKTYLENVQTSSRTPPVIAPSAANNVLFAPDSYHGLLVNRNRAASNQIRAVVQTRKASFESEPVDLHVGITVMPLADSDGLFGVAAMIDNARIEFYDFDAKVVVPPRDSSGTYLNVGPHIPYYFKKIKIPRPHSLDWDAMNAVYFGPDDPRIVRFQFLVDNSLKEPEKSKWKKVK